MRKVNGEDLLCVYLVLRLDYCANRVKNFSAWMGLRENKKRSFRVCCTRIE